ncbi:MAG: cbb3-type cytochrome oxidase subunit 3 [Planctomycetota bacterium]|jgi:cbb3-type cytochrome oxidase subunit 3
MTNRMSSRGRSFLLVAFGLVLIAVGVYMGRASMRAERVQAADAAKEAKAEEIVQLRADLRSEREEWKTAESELRDENYRLTGELENVMADRVAREQEFVQFSELLTSIVPPEAPPEILAAITGKSPEPSPSLEPDRDELARRQRSVEIFDKLHALLITERVDSLELLEAGALGDGWIGPVVFRTLDEAGRPVGSLSADRLRLEGSRAGRTLTIVLEDGYERRGGEKFPFEKTIPGDERGGERRIFLQQTLPGPWYDFCPELFGGEALSPIIDDGRWHIFVVHRRLNQLLASNVALGHYRLSALGGVKDNELRDVQMEHMDSEGHLIQRLFADRLQISKEERGVLLVLHDGIQLKGGHKYNFLGGRYRIFLPSAVHEDWEKAQLPGLTPAADSTAGSHAPL